MKVTDLRRKLLAAMAAGGLIAPGAVHAANLNTNLVVNGGFETVDTATTGGYGSPLILNWGGTLPGFAYSHNGSGGIPDFANGSTPPGGGNWYFSANATSRADNPATTDIDESRPDITNPGQFLQVIDVSGGPSGSLIASGNARYSLNAFFSSYLNDGDFGTVQAEFLSSGNAPLGLATISPFNTSTWTPDGAGGQIPIGTATVRVSAFGTALSGGPDAYIDNVDFRVGNEIILNALELTINRDDGTMTLSNRMGSSVNISGYAITSEFEGLAPVNWRSIADNYDAGSPGPNQVDAANDWSELTDPAANGDLSEADLETGAGVALAHNRTINLGNPGTWIQNPNEDLIFQYASNGVVQQGIVTFSGNGGESFALGDLNVDGNITSADWSILRSNQHADLSGRSLAEAYRLGDLTGDLQNNHPDFVAFKSAFDAANGAGSFATMLAAVPEPSVMILVTMAGVFFLPVVGRRAHRD